MKRVQMIISGRVQGVFFRATTREKARELGVQGWVMNRRDGTVEAVAEGPEDELQTLVEWAHTGPLHARVTDVETEWDEASGEFDGFSIRR